MCHGDFAPYNITTEKNVACGIIDFDTLHPGTKMEDVAYVIYRWVPFFAQAVPLSLEEKSLRAKLFLDAYGLIDSRENIAEAMITRIESLIVYMLQQANQGNPDFQQNIRDGHLRQYRNDREYLKSNQRKIDSILIANGQK